MVRSAWVDDRSRVPALHDISQHAGKSNDVVIVRWHIRAESFELFGCGRFLLGFGNGRQMRKSAPVMHVAIRPIVPMVAVVLVSQPATSPGTMLPQGLAQIENHWGLFFVGRDVNVGRFKIVMNDAAAMSGNKGLAHTADSIEHLIARHFRSVIEAIEKCGAWRRCIFGIKRPHSNREAAVGKHVYP